MLELTVRLIASLAVVVGLLLLLARVAGKRFSGREGAAVQVLHRQPLSRTASVAVLSVGSRILVVGSTDQQVQLLTELEPDELELDTVPLVPMLHEVSDTSDVLSVLPRDDATQGLVRPGTTPRAGAHRAGARHRPGKPGRLAGSVLSPDTWRQAIAAATSKAS